MRESRKPTVDDEDDAEAVAKWLAGDQEVKLSRLRRVYLRTATDAPGYPDVEISHGNFISEDAAKAAYVFAVAQRIRGWKSGSVCLTHPSGRVVSVDQELSVGNYVLREVTNTEVVFKCCTIEWDEIDRYAELRGWLPAPTKGYNGGCGELTHVEGTNGGRMPCGNMLSVFGGLAKPYYCSKCKPGRT